MSDTGSPPYRCSKHRHGLNSPGEEFNRAGRESCRQPNGNCKGEDYHCGGHRQGASDCSAVAGPGIAGIEPVGIVGCHRIEHAGRLQSVGEDESVVRGFEPGTEAPGDAELNGVGRAEQHATAPCTGGGGSTERTGHERQAEMAGTRVRIIMCRFHAFGRMVRLAQTRMW